MNPITEFIQSGILELYVMGAASPEEKKEVEQMAAAHPEVKAEVDQISLTLETYAQTLAVEPRNTVKPFIMATVDYMERMRKGEPASAPPEIDACTTAEDFRQWLERPDLRLPPDNEPITAKIIGYTPKATTAIVWLTGQTSPEIHKDEHERFLILEGTCLISVGGEENALGPGDVFFIPLHQEHYVQVTSSEPCKAILQRLTS